MLLLVADDEGAEAADEEAGVEAADDDEGDEAEELEGDEELAEDDDERLELPDDDEGAELDEPEPDEEPPADEDEPPSEPPAALTLRGERGRRSVGQRRVQRRVWQAAVQGVEVRLPPPLRDGFSRAQSVARTNRRSKSYRHAEANGKCAPSRPSRLR